ncbi:FAD-binding oxidoreductase [Conexibacter woesei]|uniref:FAD linked oxidase domain protein n=1 Tax=Conexibacter woesei (strain DSM 14684 / CCUG 47730 / CIP 108061 / JCM 11494 / NBRC 100937 / ID131577) TaxID=469383 RepID=D3FDV2_CONWI|nr:FAD-binding oxidoreductase [Conexibacter woesei]ADB51568.1 FAD linked oxidase domain protein [Conexibacter woesei DSM 14684]
MAAMKWWGWGLEGVEFTHADKPELAPFIEQRIGLDVARPIAPPARFDDLDVPAPTLPHGLRAALESAVGAEHVSVDPLDRVVHARGKSIRDLVRQRRGDLPRVPDAVVRPAGEDEVTAVLRAALDADAVVIPFGGGTSISGSLEAPADERRPVLSVDLGRLDKVLEIDEHSRLARVQAGVFGPHLEEQLRARGYTFGHFPDSFTHSTLGGWIATRSSGMQSDRYGDVADLTRGLRVVTPAGTLVTQPVPATSTGPSVREMVLGSEGRLGIVTEATVQVRRLPQERRILGYLFPTFGAGLAAMREIAASECSVSVTRVSDAPETQFSFATRKRSTPVDKLKSKALTTFLTRRLGFRLDEMCLSFIGYEGSTGHVAEQRRAVGRIVKRHGGLCIGSSPGALYDQKKFDTPYIRDFLLDRGVAADVSETAMPWSRLTPVYDAVTAAGHAAFARLGVRGYLMCHLSHSYHGGACLYFTFAFEPAPGSDMLAEYDVVKTAIQQAFVDNGATLSHHHAVGTEHARWLEQDLSAPGVAMIEALFAGTDPGRNLNPGKIV